MYVSSHPIKPKAGSVTSKLQMADKVGMAEDNRADHTRIPMAGTQILVESMNFGVAA